MHQLGTNIEAVTIYPGLAGAGYWIIEGACCLNSLRCHMKHTQKAFYWYIFFATSVITHKVLNRSRK